MNHFTRFCITSTSLTDRMLFTGSYVFISYLPNKKDIVNQSNYLQKQSVTTTQLNIPPTKMNFDYDSDFCLESDSEQQPDPPRVNTQKPRRGRPPIYQNINEPFRNKRPLLSEVNYDTYKRKKGSKTYNQPSNISLRLPPTLPFVMNEKQIQKIHTNFSQVPNKLNNMEMIDHGKQVELDDKYLEGIDYYHQRKTIIQNADTDFEQVTLLIEELKSAFPKIPIQQLVSTLHKKITIQNRTQESYMQSYRQLRIDRQIIQMYLADKKIATTCKILAEINQQNLKDPKTRSHMSSQLLQSLRERLYSIMKQAIEKFNNHARKWIQGEQLQTTILNDQQIDGIIEEQNGVECRVMLAKYWLLRQPKYKDFDELNVKLHVYLNSK